MIAHVLGFFYNFLARDLEKKRSKVESNLDIAV